MPEPMSEERLAEIRRGHRNATSRGTFWTADIWIEELLSEVERLREAQIAAPISIDSRTWSAAQLLGVARVAPDGACKHNDTTIEPVGDGEGVRDSRERSV